MSYKQAEIINYINKNINFTIINKHKLKPYLQ